MSVVTTSDNTQHVSKYKTVVLNEVEQFKKRRNKYMECKKFMLPTYIELWGNTVTYKWYESQLVLICTLFRKTHEVYVRRFKDDGVGNFQSKRRKTAGPSNCSKSYHKIALWNGDLKKTNFPNGIGIDPVSIIKWTPLLHAFNASGRNIGFVDLHFDAILRFQEYIHVDLFGSPSLYETRGKSPHGGGFLREYTDFI